MLVEEHNFSTSIIIGSCPEENLEAVMFVTTDCTRCTPCVKIAARHCKLRRETGNKL
jgi:hypothetical protein